MEMCIEKVSNYRTPCIFGPAYMEGERDLPSIVHIHPTVSCKFGVALLFGSGVIICQRQSSETAIIGQLYALSDTAPRCFL